MGIYAIKPRFQQALRVVERPLVRWRVHPDVLTISAVVLSLLGGFALFATRWTPWVLLAIPFVALLRLALNALDGMVAKDLGVARPWGEVLNELCDRLSDVALFGGLLLAPGTHVGLGIAVIILMLLSSYLGVVAKAAGGQRQYIGVMAKADRMIGLAVASVVALVWWPVLNYFLMITLAGVAITIVQRWRAAYVDLQSVR